MVATYSLPAYQGFPNSPFPLLVYAGALERTLDSETLACTFEQRFSKNHWPPAWRNGVFAYHHYHATAHEALGVFSGAAAVQFGGPSGITLEVAAGDLVVIPAGVSHKRITTQGALGIVGAYPQGQQPDRVCPPDEQPGDQGVLNTVPNHDPISGANGVLCEIWTSALG